ncbi:hypothetical protein Nizo2494_0474 [Lactiplantibacillus plantarum]|nr:hypothetical protein Nizo2457_0926 [Lactiplantibacillus plantarum]KZU31339.1 hypothetical protein Nizo2494_0474 [Lactiplantibacillus plantarum]
MIPEKWQQTLGVKLFIMVNLINLVILAVIKLASGAPVWRVVMHRWPWLVGYF